MTAATIQIADEADAQALMDYSKMVREAEQASAEKAAPKTVSINTATPQGITYKDGQAVVQNLMAQSVVTREAPLPEGFVRLSNGTVTPLKAAEAAGLTHMIVESARADRGPVASFNAGATEGVRSTPPEQTTGQTNTEAAAVDADPAHSIEVSEEGKAAITKASDALSQATALHGAFAIEALQHETISTGEPPASLPEGITPQMVEHVMDGFRAQADAVLKETGVNVNALNEMLNDNELREARVAVFHGDDKKLQELGGRARARLMKLPNDPVLLKELTANWPSNIRVTGKGNDAVVETPQGKVSWVEAVTRGLIRFN